MKILAKVRKIKKPRTSVAVVKKILEETAGSWWNFFNSTGIINPNTPAIIKLPIIARKIINPR